jgi:hypothetical protein
MTSFQLAAIVLTLTAALGYVNAKWLKLPSSVGLMAIACPARSTTTRSRC